MVSGKSYHQNVSYARHDLGGHQLDWSDQPSVYKLYPGAEMVSLSRNLTWPPCNLSELVRQTSTSPDHSAAVFSLETLSRMLTLTYSPTAKSVFAGGAFYYRSAPSAGALYPCEIYVVSRGVSGLDDGLYHFSIFHNALALIRSSKADVETSPYLTFLITAIFYRSAWKYRKRSYRYVLLDTGHLTEGLVLALKALNLPFTVSYDFADEQVNRFLGVDTEREACLATVTVGRGNAVPFESEAAWSDPPKGFKDASRVAQKETSFPEIYEIHRASSHVTASSGSSPGRLENISSIPAERSCEIGSVQWPEILDYVHTVFERRSRRNFISGSISKNYWEPLLESVIGIDAAATDAGAPRERSLCTGFIAGDVEGLQQGFYLLNPENRSVSLVKSGYNMTRDLAHVCLDQEWLASAGLHFLFLTDLEMVDRIWGPRGYRYAMMTAGRFGHRIYLTATCMGLGSCGIGAFYDGEASTLLQLNPSSSLLYAVAAGVIKKRSR